MDFDDLEVERLDRIAELERRVKVLMLDLEDCQNQNAMYRREKRLRHEQRGGAMKEETGWLIEVADEAGRPRYVSVDPQLHAYRLTTRHDRALRFSRAKDAGGVRAYLRRTGWLRDADTVNIHEHSWVPEEQDLWDQA